MYGTWIFGSAGPLRFRKDNKNMLGTAGFSINSLPKFKGVTSPHKFGNAVLSNVHRSY